MASDLSSSQGLSDAEVLAQVSTFVCVLRTHFTLIWEDPSFLLYRDDFSIPSLFSFIRAAGHESTTGALTFTLQLLADHPSAQAKLHAELSTIDDEEPNWETLNGLTYLDAVVKESLRVSPPVPGSASHF